MLLRHQRTRWKSSAAAEDANAYANSHTDTVNLTDCPTGGSPGPWTQAAPVAIDHYGGFMDSDGTFAYEGGGYSFTTSGTVNQFGKFRPGR